MAPIQVVLGLKVAQSLIVKIQHELSLDGIMPQMFDSLNDYIKLDVIYRVV